MDEYSGSEIVEKLVRKTKLSASQDWNNREYIPGKVTGILVFFHLLICICLHFATKISKALA